MFLHNAKCKQLCPAFEHVSLYSFPSAINMIPQTPLFFRSHSIFFFKRFVQVSVVQPFSSSGMVRDSKNLFFSDFILMLDSLSIAISAFPTCILTSLSADEMLLPRYEKCFSKFRGLLFNVETALSLKHLNSVLSAFRWRPMPLAACFRLGRKDLIWLWIFSRSARSFV